MQNSRIGKADIEGDLFVLVSGPHDLLCSSLHCFRQQFLFSNNVHTDSMGLDQLALLPKEVDPLSFATQSQNPAFKRFRAGL